MNKKYLAFYLILTLHLVPGLYPSARAQDPALSGGGLSESGLTAANTMQLTLKDAIQKARQASPDYKRAINQAEASYWAFRNYRSRFLPQLSLYSTLPDYSTSLTKVTNPDGTESFVRQNRSFYSLDMGLRQNVPFTGGTFSVLSNLERLDILSDPETTSYSSVPFAISYTQSSLLYNPYRWQQRIEPLRYESSKRAFVENMEEISLETTRQYFNLLAAQIQLSTARQNLANTDTLYQISQGRYTLGKIAENELLQMELSLLNARNAVSNAELSYQLTMQNLIRYLGIDRNASLQLEVPTDTVFFAVSAAEALAQAADNRQAVIEFRRRRLQAEEEVARAKGENSVSINLLANFGLSQNGPKLSDVYHDLNSQQRLQLTLSIPIMDWGVAKSRKRMAQANLELEKANIEREQLAFEQEIVQQTAQWNLQRDLLATATKARETAIKRYEITKQRYLIGKISITDLNLAQQEKDRAIETFIGALRNYWNSYHTIRRLTLYDFERNDRIVVELQEFD